MLGFLRQTPQRVEDIFLLEGHRFLKALPLGQRHGHAAARERRSAAGRDERNPFRLPVAHNDPELHGVAPKGR
jgi:hypothetical protein